MAQKWIIPREVVKVKVAEREKVKTLETAVSDLSKSIEDIKKTTKETSK